MKLLFCSLSFVLMTAFHPFYVSICQVDHNTESQSLELTFKIFVDDLNTGLKAHTDEKMWIGDEQEHADAETLVQKYLQNRVQFKVNGAPAAFNWIGKEVEEDICWVYMEIPNVPQLTTLEVTNRILLETFADQSNIVHVHANGTEKSMTMRRGQDEGKVVFE